MNENNPIGRLFDRFNALQIAGGLFILVGIFLFAYQKTVGFNVGLIWSNIGTLFIGVVLLIYGKRETEE